MQVNVTIDQLSTEGVKVFNKAVDKAYEQKGLQAAYFLFSTLKQPKGISKKITAMCSPEELQDYRTKGYRFFDDPPFETEDVTQYPWLGMLNSQRKTSHKDNGTR